MLLDPVVRVRKGVKVLHQGVQGVVNRFPLRVPIDEVSDARNRSSLFQGFRQFDDRLLSLSDTDEIPMGERSLRVDGGIDSSEDHRNRKPLPEVVAQQGDSGGLKRGGGNSDQPSSPAKGDNLVKKSLRITEPFLSTGDRFDLFREREKNHAHPMAGLTQTGGEKP